MNNKIANILKSYIKTLTWTDKIAGLVQTVNVTEKNGDIRVTKSYPISCDLTEDDCIKGHYQDLIPLSSKRSVIYFEDRGGCVFDHQQGEKLYYKSSLRLVAWLNLKLLECDDCGVSKDYCMISGDYVIDLIKILTYRPFNAGGFYSIMVHPPAQVERSVDIFSRYTYNEQSTQYLMYPFDYFALDFEVDFVINAACRPTPIQPCDQRDSITVDSDLITVDSDLITVDNI